MLYIRTYNTIFRTRRSVKIAGHARMVKDDWAVPVVGYPEGETLSSRDDKVRAATRRPLYDTEARLIRPP